MENKGHYSGFLDLGVTALPFASIKNISHSSLLNLFSAKILYCILPKLSSTSTLFLFSPSKMNLDPSTSILFVAKN